jgi:hypothetical protein
VEAQYEFDAAYPEHQPNGSNELVGMISAGGASLQMAFNVGQEDVDHAKECANALKHLTGDVKYDDKRVRFDEARRVLFISWLSVRWEHEPGQFAVGGLNEMRASFDRYFVMHSQNVTQSHDEAWSKLVTNRSDRKTFPMHPCLRGDPAIICTRSKCGPEETRRLEDNEDDDFTGAGGLHLNYTANGFADYITMLHGDPSANTLDCENWMRSFVQKDSMVKSFHAGEAGGCKAIAEKVETWTLLSGFHYSLKDLIGTGTHGDQLQERWNSMSNGKGRPVPGQDSNGEHYASYFNKAITMEVLNQLGVVDSTDMVRSRTVEWLDTAASDLPIPLAAGWLADDECNLDNAANATRGEHPRLRR